ncbi:MAG: hypothetical protein AMJ73_01565 [candidate division Zixibacteria bacterium SM1_73]|nr:MAG: hypothetical protein AMJ73_01565 [candidate division Zixibacteria bacterium SM1_73]
MIYGVVAGLFFPYISFPAEVWTVWFTPEAGMGPQMGASARRGESVYDRKKSFGGAYVSSIVGPYRLSC